MPLLRCLLGTIKGKGLPRFEHTLLALIACDIGLYILVFPTVLHSAVAHESMQITLLLSTFSSKSLLLKVIAAYLLAH